MTQPLLSSNGHGSATEIFQARARELAKAIVPKRSPESFMEVVEFDLAYERYAVESAYVREVYPIREFTTIPCTPPFVIGMVNVRGRILTLIDLKKLFELPDRGLTDHNKVLVLQQDAMEFGILADIVCGVRSIDPDDVQDPPPTLSGIRASYLKGVTPDRLIVVDAQKLLTDPHLVVREEVE